MRQKYEMMTSMYFKTDRPSKFQNLQAVEISEMLKTGGTLYFKTGRPKNVNTGKQLKFPC